MPNTYEPNTVEYAGVTLPLVKTNSIGFENVYSDDGIDYLYTKVTIDVTCHFNEDVLSSNTGNVASSVAYYTGLLSQPRQRLVVTVEGETLVSADAPDMKGGPFPDPLVINQIIGRQTIVATFRCTAYVSACPDPPYILSNRWSCTHGFDRDFYITRRISGTLVARVQNPVSESADAYRFKTIPPLPDGWVRENIEFSVTPDGLKLSYSFTDKEVYEVPPHDSNAWATTATGSYSEACDKNGINLFAEMDVTLRGPKSSKKRGLLTLAASIILDRFNLITAPNGDRTKTDIIESSAVSEKLWDNEVSIRLRVHRTAGQRAPGDNQVPFVVTDKFARRLIGTLDNKGFNLGNGQMDEYGFSKAFAKMAAWKAMCAIAGVTTAGTGASGQATSDTLATATINVGEFQGPTDPFNYTGPHTQNMNVYERNTYTFQTVQNNITLPIAVKKSSDPYNADPQETIKNVSTAVPQTLLIATSEKGRMNAFPEFIAAVPVIAGIATLMEVTDTFKVPDKTPGGDLLYEAARMVKYALHGKLAPEAVDIVLGDNSWTQSPTLPKTSKDQYTTDNPTLDSITPWTSRESTAQGSN